jgi:hypothetical protein
MARHDSNGEETIDKKYMYNKWAKSNITVKWLAMTRMARKQLTKKCMYNKWAKSKQLHDNNSNDKYI